MKERIISLENDANNIFLLKDPKLFMHLYIAWAAGGTGHLLKARIDFDQNLKSDNITATVVGTRCFNCSIH